MCAVEVGVGVDHLRLEPQPELHAERPRRGRSAGPARRARPLVDEPVAEPGGVVAPVVEPAVVEHEPLDARPGPPGRRSPCSRSRSWSKKTASQTLSTTGCTCRVGVERAQVGVPGRGQAVEPVVGGGEVDPRASCTTPRSAAPPRRAAGARRRRWWRRCAAVRSTRSTELPLQPTWTPTTRPCVVEKPAVPATTMVAASRPGPAAEPLAQPQPVVMRVPLRAALALVPPGEVEQLDVVVGAAAAPPRARRRRSRPGPVLVTVARPRRPPPATASSSSTRPSPAASSAARTTAPGLVDLLAGDPEPGASSSPRRAAVTAQVRTGEAAARVLAQQRQAWTVGDRDVAVVLVRRRSPVEPSGPRRATRPRAGRPRRRTRRWRCAGARRRSAGTAWKTSALSLVELVETQGVKQDARAARLPGRPAY